MLFTFVAIASCYTTLREPTRYEEVIKKSRFVAVAAPVQSADDALTFVKSASDPKARHNCESPHEPPQSVALIDGALILLT